MYHRLRARAPAAPRPPGCGPQRALARPPGPTLRRAPSRFVGGHAASARSRCVRRPGVSPRASEEHASGRAGGRAAHAGWPPRALARQPPACAALSLGPVQAASDARARLNAPRRSVPQAGPGAKLPVWGGTRGRSLARPLPAPPSASAWSRRLQMPGHVSPRLGGVRLGPSCPCGVATSGARSPAPGLRHPRLAGLRPRLLLVHTFGAPAPRCVKPWRAPRYCQAAYCDSDEGVRPVGHSQRASPGTAAPAERHLQVTRRPPLASPLARLDATAHRRQDTDAPQPAAGLAPHGPPCALRADPTRLPHTICSGTMRACENGGPPPLLFLGGGRPPPLPKWEGRREASSSSPPVFGRGGASGAQAGGPRPRPGSRLGAAHLRTGGEEECTGTADNNPGCNYLVRGYSPSMHYFWRGDMPHFSSPLPFQRGARGCRAAAVRRPWPARAGHSRSRAAAVPRPPRPARSCAPSISAGMAPLAGAGQLTPLQTGGQPGAARAAQVRRGVTAATSNWPPHLPRASRSKRDPPPLPAALPHFHTTFDSAHNAILR